MGRFIKSTFEFTISKQDLSKTNRWLEGNDSWLTIAGWTWTVCCCVISSHWPTPKGQLVVWHRGATLRFIGFFKGGNFSRAYVIYRHSGPENLALCYGQTHCGWLIHVWYIVDRTDKTLVWSHLNRIYLHNEKCRKKEILLFKKISVLPVYGCMNYQFWSILTIFRLIYALII